MSRTTADISDPGWRRRQVLLKLAVDQPVADHASMGPLVCEEGIGQA